MFEIVKFRLGFATNSSSTHSIIFLPPDFDVKNLICGGKENDYGWEDFRLVSTDQRARYAATMLLSALRQIMPGHAAAVIAENWGHTHNVDAEATIDHQSVYVMPKDFEHPAYDFFPSRKFFEAFRDFLLQDNVAILAEL